MRVVNQRFEADRVANLNCSVSESNGEDFVVVAQRKRRWNEIVEFRYAHGLRSSSEPKTKIFGSAFTLLMNERFPETYDDYCAILPPVIQVDTDLRTNPLD